MKDDRDSHTQDGLPKKIGRPTAKDTGPMTPAERKRKSREAKRLIGITKEVTLDERIWERLETIYTRQGVTVTECLTDLIKSRNLPRKV